MPTVEHLSADAALQTVEQRTRAIAEVTNAHAGALGLLKALGQPDAQRSDSS
jgi:hypothetical protein